MHLPPLVEGRLVRRYKRFFADVEMPDGEVITAHCPNPGAMLGVKPEGARAWLSRSDNPKRKLAHTWELVEADGAVVGINTNRPNALAEEAIESGVIPGLADYDRLRREVRYGEASRIDILLESEGRPPCYVEVKNVHLRREAGLAEFPDSVTARGAKHLRELAHVVAEGGRAVQLFIIQRNDCDALALADDIDPNYADAFADALKAGVEPLAYACEVSVESIRVVRPVPMRGLGGES